MWSRTRWMTSPAWRTTHSSLSALLGYSRESTTTRTTNDNSRLNARSVYVALVNLDGSPYPAGYSQAIDFQSSFPLPTVKYFDFENVLPGRYMAYVSVLGQGWYMKKEEVSVTTHMKFISLQLVYKGEK